MRKHFIVRDCLMEQLGQMDSAQVILSFKDRQVTVGELIDDINSLRMALYNHGWEGKTIAAIAQPTYEYIALVLAVVCSKMTLLPLYDGWTMEEKESYIKKGSAIICYEEDEKIADLLEEGRRLKETGQRFELNDDVLPTDVSMLLFTSGTTGEAKAVQFMQKAWQPYMEQIRELGWNLSSIGPQLIALPLFHLYGLALLLAFLSAKIPVVISAGLRYFIAELEALKPTTIFLVPGQVSLLYKMMVDGDDGNKGELRFGYLKRVFFSGASLSKEIAERFKSLGICICSAYSMTETSGIAIDPPEVLDTKPGSSGRIMPCARDYVRINEPDQNDYGELLVSKDYVGIFKGYLDDPKGTAEILYDGWLHTGDVARIDEDGDLFIIGRIKNTIILSNGENVSPEKLERKVMELGGVRECLVYEEDDRLAVKIVPDDTETSFTEEGAKRHFTDKILAMNRNMPNHERIEKVWITDQLPKNPAGKIKRR